MSSSNITDAQRSFSDLSLKTKSSSSSSSSKVTVTFNYDKSICKKSPEIYDLIRFQRAIMSKYLQSKDQHFKNMSDALTPQIEEKIRAFKRLK